MNTENGVWECGSDGETTKGVLKYWSLARPNRFCVTGPEASAPPEALEAGADGKRWAGRRVNLGKGGKMMGKRTGFSHFETALTRLFPHDSTQVVDFPRMYAVRGFWKAMKWVSTDGTRIKHGLGKEIEPKGPSQARLGTDLGETKRREMVRVLTRKSAKFHETPRKF